MTHVAVVGGGAAGMGAAWGLVRAGLDVTLFEGAPRLGGHCFGVPVSLADGSTVHVDAGVSDFNQVTFVSFRAMLEELGLSWRPVNQDASFMRPDGSTVWYTRAGERRFQVPLANTARFDEEIRRFNSTCTEVLEDAAYADWTLQRYLDERHYSQEFRALYLYPRAAGAFPSPDRRPESYMVRTMVAFWRIHGIVGGGRAERMCLVGGMHTYTGAFARWFEARGGRLHLATQVLGLARRDGGIRLRAVDADGAHHTFRFQQVVIAANSNQVVPLLEDPSQEEMRIYGGFQWQRARVAVHQDPRLMPDEREAWGAYNYVIAEGDAPVVRPTITFFPNRLASLGAHVPDVFVTLNPHREPDPARVLRNQFFVHPAAGLLSRHSSERLEALQGRRATWYAGAYLREPFVHEQAFRSGLDVAERLVGALSAPCQAYQRTQSFDEFLLEIPLFSGLDASVLNDVQLVARPFEAAAGTVLCRQGELADGMYLVKHGRVRVVARVPGEGPEELALLGRGAVIGEVGLLDREPRMADVVVLEHVEGYFVSRARFEVLRSDLGLGAFAVMSRILAAISERLRSVLGRIALLPGIRPVRPAQHLPAAGESEPLTSILDPLVRGSPLLARLADEAPEGNDMRVWRLARGTLLAREGERARSCWLVVRGALRSCVGPDAEQLAIHGPGAVVGAGELLDDGPRAFTLEVREDTLLVEIDRSAFERLRRGGTPAALALFDAVAHGLVTLLRRATQHASRLSATAAPPVAEVA